jgi:deoxycytidine triphosphate deaminase
MFLSDIDIRRELAVGGIKCAPLPDANISNSSIDLRLGRRLVMMRPALASSVVARPGMRTNQSCATMQCDCNGRLNPTFFDCEESIFDSTETFLLVPGDFILGSTIEQVGSTALNILGQISDKSTLARLGLSTFFGAGYIDPGNVLNITGCDGKPRAFRPGMDRNAKMPIPPRVRHLYHRATGRRMRDLAHTNSSTITHLLSACRVDKNVLLWWNDSKRSQVKKRDKRAVLSP